MFRFFIFLLIILISKRTNSQNNSLEIDNIKALRKLSIDDKLNIENQIAHAHKAVELSKRTKIDSTILESNRFLSFAYLRQDELELFKGVNEENLILSKKLRDSIIMADVNQNLGFYHSQQLQQDSAYYYYSDSAELFGLLKRYRSQGEVLLNIADIQEVERDYIGSEENATLALSLITKLPLNDNNLDTLWSLYNLLGVLSTRLEQYEEAFSYHEKALDISKQLSDNFFYITSSKNNLAYLFSETGSYKEAIKIYKELLTEYDLLEIDPETYAIVLGNIANSEFKGGNKKILQIKKDFRKAYKISDSLGVSTSLSTILNDMSEFFFKKK